MRLEFNFFITTVYRVSWTKDLVQVHSLHLSKEEGIQGKEIEITKWQGDQLILSHMKHTNSPKAIENV